MPAGRPSTYTPETTDMICEAIAQGGALYLMCERADWPGESTVYQWLEKHQEFAEKYARARERQADRNADEIIVIADNAKDANKARVQIDARKWRASKLAAKRYGDKQELTHQAGDTLAALLREIDGKSRGLPPTR